MKKIAIMSILLAVPLLVAAGNGQETPKPAGESAKVTEKSVKRQGPRAAFTGTVFDINIPSRTISIKERGSVVTFDAGNPVFSGYRGLSDVRRGDRVAVSYTADGIRIARFSGKVPEETKVAATTAPGKHAKDSGKLQRREKRGNGGTFDDVDANKDGRVTPVELSVLVTDITMVQFHQYDKNGDGVLDKGEFLQMIRQQRSGKEK